uniref:helix-hairpin-helix domain-containing protein n=1 Tax=Agathobacter sp. TaxID=2021311 RepID=UPI004055C6B0
MKNWISYVLFEHRTNKPLLQIHEALSRRFGGFLYLLYSEKICIIAKSVLPGILLAVSVALLLCGCGADTQDYVAIGGMESTETEQETAHAQLPNDSSIGDASQESDLELCIYVCGHVKNPGVYVLQSGSRVYDAIQAAGGFSEYAAKEYWNQARLLADGEMIYVPSEEEAAERSLPGMGEAGTQTNNAEEGKININTASKEELMEIPGVGETRAESILAYRKEHGEFSEIADIKNVSGIKDGVFDKIKDYIIVN